MDKDSTEKQDCKDHCASSTLIGFGAVVFSALTYFSIIDTNKLLNRPYLEIQIPVFEFYDEQKELIEKPSTQNSKYFKMKVTVINHGNLPALKTYDTIGFAPPNDGEAASFSYIPLPTRVTIFKDSPYVVETEFQDVEEISGFSGFKKGDGVRPELILETIVNMDYKIPDDYDEIIDEKNDAYVWPEGTYRAYNKAQCVAKDPNFIQFECEQRLNIPGDQIKI